MISAQHEPAQKLLLPLVLKQVFKYTTLKEKKKKKEKKLWAVDRNMDKMCFRSRCKSNKKAFDIYERRGKEY